MLTNMLTAYMAARGANWYDPGFLAETLKAILQILSLLAPALLLTFTLSRFLRNPDSYSVQERMWQVAGWCALAFVVR